MIPKIIVGLFLLLSIFLVVSIVLCPHIPTKWICGVGLIFSVYGMQHFWQKANAPIKVFVATRPENESPDFNVPAHIPAADIVNDNVNVSEIQ